MTGPLACGVNVSVLCQAAGAGATPGGVAGLTGFDILEKVIIQWASRVV